MRAQISSAASSYNPNRKQDKPAVVTSPQPTNPNLNARTRNEDGVTRHVSEEGARTAADHCRGSRADHADPDADHRADRKRRARLLACGHLRARLSPRVRPCGLDR